MVKKEIKNRILVSIGVFILCYGLLAMSYAVYRGKPDWVFWGCYIGMVIIGIGAIKKDGSLIASQIVIIALYLIVWNIDFFYQLITNNSLWGVTDYFFREMLLVARLISLEHIFLLPLSLYAIYLTGLKTKDYWKLSIVQMIIVVSLARWLTKEEFNINCVYRPCVDFLYSGNYYIFLWLAILIGFILVNTYILNKLFYKKS